MANIAKFVSVLIAQTLRIILFYTFLISVIGVLNDCAGIEITNEQKNIAKEFQNGEEIVESFANQFVEGQQNRFGRLKSRVVVSNGETLVAKAGEQKLAKHFIPYSSGSDRGPYEFEGTYGFTHGHNIPHTHVVANGHRQPGRGIRRALLRQRLRRLLRQLGGNSGRKRPFLTKTVPVLPLPVGDQGAVEPDESTFEGSYVAVSGRPGSRTVHVVNGKGGVNLAGTVSRKNGIYIGGKRYLPVDGFGEKSGRPWINGPLGGLGNRGVSNAHEASLGYGGDIDDLSTSLFGFAASGRKKPNYFLTDHTDDAGYSPLPRCSYINTDFIGDDVGDGKGISTGSAINCKQSCQNSDTCKFYTYRDGWARDCYLKRGRRGDPNPQSAIPKIGFISGTKGNDDCLCLPNGQDSSEEICPIRSSRPVYPWKRKGTKDRDKAGNDGTFRFDYDDYDYFNRLDGQGGVDPGVRGSSIAGALPDADEDVEPVTTRPAGGRRAGGRRNRPRDRGQLSNAGEESKGSDGRKLRQKTTEKIKEKTDIFLEDSDDYDGAELLRQKVTEKIEERAKILDDLGEDVEFFDVE